LLGGTVVVGGPPTGTWGTPAAGFTVVVVVELAVCVVEVVAGAVVEVVVDAVEPQASPGPAITPHRATTQASAAARPATGTENLDFMRLAGLDLLPAASARGT
jgi:hypothetical protein